MLRSLAEPLPIREPNPSKRFHKIGVPSRLDPDILAVTSVCLVERGALNLGVRLTDTLGLYKAADDILEKVGRARAKLDKSVTA